MDYKALQNHVEEYVRTYFAGHPDDRLTFHNLRHTQDVVKAAMQMGDHYQLSERDYAILLTAAWFHDIGYFTDALHHEQMGIELSTNYLKENGVTEEDATFLQEVTDCILATKMPQSPKNLLGEILCDADLFHLGTDDFSDKNSALRKEKETFKGEKISKSAWREVNIKFITAHKYFTDYARLLLDDTKEKHLHKLKEKEEEKAAENAVKQAETPLTAVASIMAAGEASQTETKGKKGKKGKGRPDKGIETLFRIASNNNQRLSNMADNKAHIMITVNSIILSAVISLLLGKLGHNPHLTIPSFITLIVCVFAIIFSILATRPSIPKGRFSQQEIDDKSVNLMFFGNFYKMRLEEYADGMRKVMDDSDFLYGSLIKDVYSQGVVLGKKYKLLRISYSIFMFGLVIAVLSFLIAIIIYYSHQQG